MNKSRVLLVEDDAWLAESYVRVLQSEYAVSVVATSLEAMDVIDDKVFDVVIADVMLENGLVIDLLHELQTHLDTMDVPVIVCSSLAALMDLDDLKAYGVIAVLDKSKVTPAILRVEVQRALVARAV